MFDDEITNDEMDIIKKRVAIQQRQVCYISFLILTIVNLVPGIPNERN